MNLYNLNIPEKISVPIVLNFPHSGTFIPESISKNIRKQAAEELDDTDWHLEQLYDFAFKLKIPIMKANYHRWVVDLNRNPAGISLYNDGRHITQLVTTTDFNGNAIYEAGQEPSEEEIQDRKTNYFDTYHLRLNQLLLDVHAQFGKVFLWDAHSIRRMVPSISPDPFPDLIIGTNSSTTCHPELEKSLYETLNSGPYSCELNSLFKGGYITRNYGNPSQKIYSFQLEMAKDLYLVEDELVYSEQQANTIKLLLKDCFNVLIKNL